MTYIETSTKSRRARAAAWLASLGAAAVLALAGALPAGAQTLEERVTLLERKAATSENRLLKWHLSGYMSAGFEVTETDNDPQGSDNTFTPALFAPIFHFLYNDIALFQAEPEITTDADGATEVELEYASVALLLHDRYSLVVGQFLSPIGQFQERLHPSWVNKLPSAPAGFGHGGAAPLTDLGLQLRGGVPLGGSIFGYTAYVANGPHLSLHHGRVEIEHEASSASRDEKAFGGRFSLLFPARHLEFGVSTIIANKLSGPAAGLQTRPDYRAVGMDGAYTPGPLDVRFEYLASTLNEFVDAEGDAAPETEPSFWYAQAAYQFGRWEPVVRYGVFNFEAWNAGGNALVERETKRATIGLNYLFGPSLIAKFAYETDDLDFADDEKRYLFQVAFGF